MAGKGKLLKKSLAYTAVITGLLSVIEQGPSDICINQISMLLRCEWIVSYSITINLRDNEGDRQAQLSHLNRCLC